MSKTKYHFEVRHMEDGDAEIFAFSFMTGCPGSPGGKDRIIKVPAFKIVKMSMFGPIGPVVDPVVKPPTAKEKSRGITMEQKIAERLRKFDRLYNKYQFEVKRLGNGDAEIFAFRETTSPDLPGTVIEVEPLSILECAEIPTPVPLVKLPNALEKFLGVTMEQKIARRLKKFDKVYNRE